MKNNDKRYLNYYVCYNTILTKSFRKVASISDNTIISKNERFNEVIKNSNAVFNSNAVTSFLEPKIKYIVKDSNNGVVAKLDKRYNIYNLNNEYIGSIKDITSLLACLFTTTLAVVLTIILVLINLSFSSRLPSASPEYIRIQEENGEVVIDRWNVFGRLDEEKKVHPGKNGIYNFFLVNESREDLKVTLKFDEKNLHRITMRFRLSCNDVYLSGNDEYMTIKELNQLDMSELFVKSNSQLRFRLDWKWVSISDEDDTRIGSLDKAEYTIMVKVYFESKEE